MDYHRQEFRVLFQRWTFFFELRHLDPGNNRIHKYEPVSFVLFLAPVLELHRDSLSARVEFHKQGKFEVFGVQEPY